VYVYGFWTGQFCTGKLKFKTRNVGHCPTWRPPCRIWVALYVQRRKVLLTPTTRAPCSNAAKTQNPLKFAAVPQTRQQISAASGPKFTIFWGHVGRHCCLTSFFLIVSSCLSCEDTARQSCAMVPKWRFLRPVFAASRVLHISDMHSKFTLRPHHVWKYGRHPISGRWD